MRKDAGGRRRGHRRTGPIEGGGIARHRSAVERDREVAQLVKPQRDGGDDRGRRFAERIGGQLVDVPPEDPHAHRRGGAEALGAVPDLLASGAEESDGIALRTAQKIELFTTRPAQDEERREADGAKLGQ